MGNNPSQHISNINSSLSNTIVNVLQSANNNTKVSQTLTAQCTNDDIRYGINGYYNSINDTSDTSLIVKTITDPSNNNLTSEELTDVIKDIASLPLKICSMSNVNMSSSLNLTNIDTQTNYTTTSITNKIKNSLSQYSNANTTQDINNVTNSVVSIMASIAQSIKNKTNTSQNLNFTNYGGKIITMNQSVDIVSNILQNTQITADSINSLSTTITQVSLSTSIYQYLILIAITMVIVFFVISLIMALKRSSGIGAFFYNILPKFIWLVLSGLLTYIIVSIKPEFLSYYSNDVKNTEYKTKKLNTQYTAAFLITSYILLFFVIKVIFLLINFFKK